LQLEDLRDLADWLRGEMLTAAQSPHRSLNQGGQRTWKSLALVPSKNTNHSPININSHITDDPLPQFLVLDPIHLAFNRTLEVMLKGKKKVKKQSQDLNWTQL
jgi:hypothetical protein